MLAEVKTDLHCDDPGRASLLSPLNDVQYETSVCIYSGAPVVRQTQTVLKQQFGFNYQECTLVPVAGRTNVSGASLKAAC